MHKSTARYGVSARRLHDLEFTSAMLSCMWNPGTFSTAQIKGVNGGEENRMYQFPPGLCIRADAIGPSEKKKNNTNAPPPILHPS